MLLNGLPQLLAVTAVPCVNTQLRRVKVIKAHIENVKHLNEEKLERKLKEKVIELTRLLDEKI